MGLNNQDSERTLVTLANANELVASVAQGVLGNEVADTLNGSPLSRSIIYNLAQTCFQRKVTPYLGEI
jgi:hypothetical protein